MNGVIKLCSSCNGLDNTLHTNTHTHTHTQNKDVNTQKRKGQQMRQRDRQTCIHLCTKLMYYIEMLRL